MWVWMVFHLCEPCNGLASCPGCISKDNWDGLQSPATFQRTGGYRKWMNERINEWSFDVKVHFYQTASVAGERSWLVLFNNKLIHHHKVDNWKYSYYLFTDDTDCFWKQRVVEAARRGVRRRVGPSRQFLLFSGYVYYSTHVFWKTVQYFM